MILLPFGLCVGTTKTDYSINVTNSRVHYSIHKLRLVSIGIVWYSILPFMRIGLVVGSRNNTDHFL